MIRISRWLPAMVARLLRCSSAGDSPDPSMGSVSLALQSNGVELTTSPTQSQATTPPILHAHRVHRGPCSVHGDVVACLGRGS